MCCNRNTLHKVKSEKSESKPVDDANVNVKKPVKESRFSDFHKSLEMYDKDVKKPITESKYAEFHKSLEVYKKNI